MELYLHSPNTPSWRGAQLKHTDNFTFYSMRFHSFNNKGTLLLELGIQNLLSIILETCLYLVSHTKGRTKIEGV
jgi:hypothetical protein